jgi:hypothetical protein
MSASLGAGGVASTAAGVRRGRRPSAAVDGGEVGFVRFVGIGVLTIYLGKRRPVERNRQTAANPHTATAPANRNSMGTS